MTRNERCTAIVIDGWSLAVTSGIVATAAVDSHAAYDDQRG